MEPKGWLSLCTVSMLPRMMMASLRLLFVMVPVGFLSLMSFRCSVAGSGIRQTKYVLVGRYPEATHAMTGGISGGHACWGPWYDGVDGNQ